MERLETTVTKKVELDYLLYLPGEPAAPMPLLLFLHGSGERGNDLSLVKKHGPPMLIENGTDLPFIVAAPQCPEGRWWETGSLAALLDHLLERDDIDIDRLYLTGLSMGGYGTWALADACPGRFAAIAPVCGPFTWVNPGNFKNIPAWCFHGAMDDTVPVDDSIRMVRWLRENGADVRFTIYPDVGHDSWEQAYDGSELYDWLLQHRGAPVSTSSSKS